MTQIFTKLPAATAALFASLALLFGALAPVDTNAGYLEIAAITATELA